MKKMKKIASILLAMIMVLSMTVTAFAADGVTSKGATTKPKTTIIINDDKTAIYYAYKILDATSNEEANKYTYAVNGDYRTALKRALDIAENKEDGTEKTEEEIDAEIIKKLEGYDNETMIAFSKKLYDIVKDNAADKHSVLKDDKPAFVDVDQGFWLLADRSPSKPANESYSTLILRSAGQKIVNVDPKKDTVKVEKEVKENSDGEWGSSADYEIGDDVPFRIFGKVANDYMKQYETYTYTFHDTLSAGLTFKEETVKLFIGDKDALDKGEGIEITNDNYTVTKKEEVKAGDTVVTEITIAFNNFKNFILEHPEANTIAVTYDATLNERAVIAGKGNPNKVKLEYSNNPNDTESTGITPEVVAIVYTFELDVTKVDQNDNKLAGAGFTLYRIDGEKHETKATWTFEGGDATSFTFKGLEKGMYELKETTVPDGYNPADSIVFKVVPEYDKSNGQLTSLKVTDKNGNPMDEKFTIDLHPGRGENIAITIKNIAGSMLPSTGGIGTTIFTVAGLILMAVAGALLLLKKKNANNN